MQYVTPEMRVLGDAAKVLRDFTKSATPSDSLDPNDMKQTNPAYDLDE